ncbi:hypothetical protein [Gellertiella hungarica]|uniref:Uncharacterized protein n=1 Tax=Gellertiella hungarica TaxID=1572859 RepID=A0A7W6NK09_9HYPH|nr:hypothetical protein [Gellertiella hungarica]MBB4064059.1 hypothetical protein [Gellertiella hungarica]
MPDHSIFPSSDQFLKLVEGQARLEAKLDAFFAAQTTMKTEIDGMKTDIAAVKSDVAEIKSQRRATKSYLAGIAAVAGGISWVASQFLDPLMKKFFGI